jgi:EAL domain-containing protein (putative c-di-GMP-specific phosphodiesterase class I)
VQERLEMKNGLSTAIGNNELSLHYQPKLEIGSGLITGVEALMRWENKELGHVSPVKFIPVLEETGMVVEVGDWALRTACEQHMKWLDAGLPPIRIAVNLSARQLREPTFVENFEKIMKETGVTSDSLELEITESMLMSDSHNSVIALDQLHNMGMHVAMDDFGTGYSSLSYLKKFPIDTIKIDRSFVADIATDTDDAEIIRTIITMGHTLNRRVVAEGVETEEQLSLLRQYKCDEIQGYFFSRPQRADDLTAFLTEHNFTNNKKASA